MNSTTLQPPLLPSPQQRQRAAGTALWLFIAVVSTLFTLFVTAYAMRMDGAADWSPIGLPSVLWLSTALLAASSVLLQCAARAAAAGRGAGAQRWMFAAAATAVGFLSAQLWAWQTLLDARVSLASNPAASFFYLLTALHGLHVLGGLVAWSLAMQGLAPTPDDARSAAWRIALCARYWHFLLMLWLLLFATLDGLTPELVRIICGRG